MRPRLDHVEFTVSDLDRAELFYDAFLPLVGFDLQWKRRDEDPGHEYRIVEYGDRALNLGLVCPRPAYANEAVCRRRPGSVHHLAFAAGSREEVDHIFRQVRAIPGVTIVAPPNYYPEYTPDYYAFFCKDTEGIKLEVVHFDRPACF